MKKLILSILVFLGLAACAPSKPMDSSKPTPQQYDFKCIAKDDKGVVYRYGYYKHVVDATKYNMGMRNFVLVELQIDDRFNSIDINEDGNTLELQKMYLEKVIYLNTVRGAYMVKTNYYENGGLDTGIIVEHLGVPVTLIEMKCE